MTLRLGIDVGGTNTDAVILDEKNNVLAKAKSPTTPDVMTGILNSLEKVLNESGVDPGEIKYAMLGTTHATNAIVERKNLAEIAIIRIGKPATLAITPLTGWPEDLREKLGKHVYIVQGGHEYDGREIAPLDEGELKKIADELKDTNIEAIAISSVFSPVNSEHEEKAAEILRGALGDSVAITLSHEIGSIGLLERENAAILNAAVTKVMKNAVRGFENALEEKGVYAKLYITQNDGTLMSADYAVKYPVLTIASGPTNSLRGAAFLSNEKNAIVVDVGGTTSDIGILVNGFPRESAVAVEIGGVRTNFRMPDLISIGLGGGSIVRIVGDGARVGPESVGYRIVEEALVFGGNTLTATDIAVAAGRYKLGDVSRVQHLDKSLVEKAIAKIDAIVEDAIDRIKTSPEPTPVILVGGGSILLSNKIKGASKVIRPQNFDVANAIGAAIAQVSGEVDRVYSLEQLGREKAIEDAKKKAIEEAIKAGADPETVEIVNFEEIPLAYLPGNATRIRVKAAGYLKA
ncbi:hydantoinase/oxoprolinase N-terminal domain-containing protein [Thermococcus sp.]